ncbi:hypothetical protein RJ640_012123, partial [Escallonia rubra]
CKSLTSCFGFCPRETGGIFRGDDVTPRSVRFRGCSVNSSYVTVSNPNRDAFTHYDSSLQLAYSGTPCQYKVLGLGGDCTANEIRSAYRRLALQHHPDKLAQFGISPTAYRRLALQAYQTSPFP